MLYWTMDVWDIQWIGFKNRYLEINKVSFSCFDDKIFIQNNGYDRLALGY